MSVEVVIPSLGESVVEATVGRWLKGEGDTVTAGESIVELETDKVNMDVPAPADGTIHAILKQEGETVAIGDVIAVVSDGGVQISTRTVGEERSPAPTPRADSDLGNGAGSSTSRLSESTSDDAVEGEHGRVSPLARRVAAEHGIDLNQIPGSGPSGRIKRDDVTAYLHQTEQPNAPASTPVLSNAPTTRQVPSSLNTRGDGSENGGRREERIRMSRRRQTIARRLVEAQQTAAMLTTFNEVDMSAIVAIRTRRRDSFKERNGIGLGFMSFFTRASIGALKAFPRLNAEIQADEMILKHYYDIGIAVGTDEGLVVPVIRNADRLTFAEIERQIADLAQRARSGSLGLSDLQGGTFTVTNGGIYGSLMSTPILNTPQVGILGLHKIQERPIVVNGEIAVRPMMYLALSYDHRIVDGSEAVRFLVRIKELIEDPEALLLEG